MDGIKQGDLVVLLRNNGRPLYPERAENGKERPDTAATVTDNTGLFLVVDQNNPNGYHVCKMENEEKTWRRWKWNAQESASFAAKIPPKAVIAVTYETFNSLPTDLGDQLQQLLSKGVPNGQMQYWVQDFGVLTTVARQGDQVVGCACFNQEESQLGVFVVPQVRGQGVATQLCQDLVAAMPNPSPTHGEVHFMESVRPMVEGILDARGWEWYSESSDGQVIQQSGESL